jgi:hypothetical protein
MGLLVFVAVAGLPIIGVPSLRHRLSTRVMTLKEAMYGDIKPATLEIGANHQPFPGEYERPVPQMPSIPTLSAVTGAVKSAPLMPSAPAPATSSARSAGPRPRTASRAAKIETPGESTTPAAEEESPQSAEQAASSAEPELKYQKGMAEQEAYNLLLKSYAAVAGLVQGSNPSLKFISWDAASRGEDVYWVRLKFQSEGNPNAEYIWQIKLQSNEAAPLNYNARSIS